MNLPQEYSNRLEKSVVKGRKINSAGSPAVFYR